MLLSATEAIWSHVFCRIEFTELSSCLSYTGNLSFFLITKKQTNTTFAHHSNKFLYNNPSHYWKWEIYQMKNKGTIFILPQKKDYLHIRLNQCKSRDDFSRSSIRIRNDGSKTRELLKQPANYIEQ